MKVTIIGCGYVGLVTGACLAELGNDVLCIDNNVKKIETLEAGGVPIYEPGLKEMLMLNIEEGRIRFSTSIKEGVEHGIIIFICVDTPPQPSGEVDLSSVERVSREIALHLKEYRLIVEKSTVPVRTSEWVIRTVKKHIKGDVPFDVASNPEFLREGTALADFMHPDRVVIGTSTEQASSLLVQLYEPLNAPLLITDINSAELIKHSANAFLALKISFINAVAQICERSGADVLRVAKGIGLDKRIGMEFLRAGVGFGGSCFPKDLSAFIHTASELGYEFDLLKEVQRINEEQKKCVSAKLASMAGDLGGKKVAVLGLAFKADTDDMRNAPSLDIIEDLKKRGADVHVYDPVAMEKARDVLDGVTYCPTPYETLAGADAAVVVTDWREFSHLDLLRVRQEMKRPLILDGRNIYDPRRMKNLGFEYRGIGR
jgi:UDPglucose 6-dehydrogenase